MTVKPQTLADAALTRLAWQPIAATVSQRHAGRLALACRQPPRAVRADPHLLADFPRTLEGRGVLLAWPPFGALLA